MSAQNLSWDGNFEETSSICLRSSAIAVNNSSFEGTPWRPSCIFWTLVCNLSSATKASSRILSSATATSSCSSRGSRCCKRDSNSVRDECHCSFAPAKPACSSSTALRHSTSASAFTSALPSRRFSSSSRHTRPCSWRACNSLMPALNSSDSNTSLMRKFNAATLASSCSRNFEIACENSAEAADVRSASLSASRTRKSVSA
mmetsp:Transcript_44279/g.141727  ORF Transcript_44279/g.141727 Transcript_44279/m.141727 type:complete len:202 (-) Transcript_44279:162-767(-)